MHAVCAEDFATFRRTARELLARAIAPDAVLWRDDPSATDALPGLLDHPRTASTRPADSAIHVPRAFIALAEHVACHRDPGRFDALYRVLYRLAHGEPRLLAVSTDPDVRRLELLDRAVRRDLHKTHAFVRFRLVEDPDGARYVAWHRPEHRVLRLAAPFFVERFRSQRWSILTPDGCASWDCRALHFGPGVSRTAAPEGDALEDLWRAYYAAVFNPARVNPRAMRAELPMRHWATLPEAALIADLVREAPARVRAMAAAAQPSAAAHIVPGATLPVLRAASAGCVGCTLHARATQTVFGEGPPDAAIVLVGEQPGDEEDRVGRPFVGPAGQLLDRALAEIGLDRARLYRTNAVKHFGWREGTGPRRIHARPRLADVAACRPWLDAELAALRPRVVVCLGATAARALLGPLYRDGQDRGRVFATEGAPSLLATYHPAALLRTPDPTRRTEMYREWLGHLRTAADLSTRVTPGP